MTEPLVSVLSITYNHSSYIAQAIDSFLAQETEFPFEIVIGEDCSTDGTREIVYDYAGRYPEIIRVVTSDTNVGVMRNFLRTFDACRGKYVAICDGDDYWHHPGKLQIQVDFLEANPHYGLVHSDIDVLGGDRDRGRGYYGRRAKPATATPNAEDILALKYVIYMCTVCCQRNVMSKVIENDPTSFSGSFPTGDIPLFIGFARLAPIKFLEVSLATYRPHSASLTRCYSKRASYLRSLELLYRHLISKYQVSDEVASAWVYDLQHSRLRFAYWKRDRQAAGEIFENMLDEVHPVSFRSKVFYWSLQVPLLDILVRPVLSFRKWWINRKPLS